MSKIVLYCDGSCNNKTGNNGGYGIVMINGSIKQFCGGRYDQTTSARMELLAVLRGLEKCPTGSIVEVWSDNEYCVNSFVKGWIFKWNSSNFVNRKNADLLKLLLEQYDRLEGMVDFYWLRGHAGNEYNELADKLAGMGAQRTEIIYDVIVKEKT